MVPGQLPCLVTPMQTSWDTVEGKPSTRAGACPWVQSTAARTLTAWLGLVVPHLEQPGCISSFVSGLLAKGDQGAEKDALFPGLIPEGSWETVKAQPHGGPVELTITPHRHSFHQQCSPLWSRHGAGYHAWHFTQISSSLTL